ncbi:MAG TPA: hypothetical protein PJ994_12815 [Tepidiformaceae bacterium]|nr:hypothetical protein [Tepidiformaceae bacterium]HMO95681.1 hypothetical protein [Tepidiformaceae bacterium]
MTLIDTSSWIAFLRGREAQVRQLLESNQALLHPFVLGELLLGNLATDTIPVL